MGRLTGKFSGIQHLKFIVSLRRFIADPKPRPSSVPLQQQHNISGPVSAGCFMGRLEFSIRDQIMLQICFHVVRGPTWLRKVAKRIIRYLLGHDCRYFTHKKYDAKLEEIVIGVPFFSATARSSEGVRCVTVGAI